MTSHRPAAALDYTARVTGDLVDPVDRLTAALDVAEGYGREGDGPWPLAETLLAVFPALDDAGLSADEGVLVASGSAVGGPCELEVGGTGRASGKLPRVIGDVTASKLLVPVETSSGAGLLVVDTTAANVDESPALRTWGSRRLLHQLVLTDSPATSLFEEAGTGDVLAAIDLLLAAEAVGIGLGAIDSVGRAVWAEVEAQRLQFAFADAAMQVLSARAAIRVASEEMGDVAFRCLASAARVSAIRAARQALVATQETTLRLGRDDETSRLADGLDWVSSAPWTEAEAGEAIGRALAEGFDRWDVTRTSTDPSTSQLMGLPQELVELRDLVSTFVEERLIPLEDRLETEGDLDPEMWKTVESQGRELGLNALSVPAEHGGAGLGMLGQIVVAEAMGHVAVGFRHVIGSPAGAQVLAQFGTPDQHERYLYPWIAGERWGAWAATEPEAGSDLGNMSTRAVRDGERWILDGTKHFITGADRADFFILFARTTVGIGVKGLTAFLIDKETPGFSVGREQKMMGRGGLHSYELHMESVALGDDQRLGPVDKGFKVLITNVGQLRLLVSAHCVGVADRLLRIGQDWCRNRKQFDRPIGEFGILQSYLADSLVELLECRASLYSAARTLEDGQEARNETAAVKAMCSEMVGRVADRVMQVLGGYGYCKDLPVEALYRAVRLWRIAEGSSEIQRMLLWRGIAGGWWPGSTANPAGGN